ncbi:unnamed protein product [Paramecium sonneborni]|uniref:MORN repeat-containing protein 3 n=1 Tax=Paramecium sonneborni TaxID=65129 RepID=A0A8S1QUI3_9CILI|nr:unnamed protein product [Paramecium sonneborni]
MKDSYNSNFIQIDEQIYKSKSGNNVIILENVNKATFVKLQNLKNIQNEMAEKQYNQGYIIKIGDLIYNQDKQITEVWLQNQDYLKYIKNIRALDEYLKCELLNSACVLINILFQNQYEILPKLTNENFFFDSEKLMISFLTDNFKQDNQYTIYNVIAELMIQIIENKSCLLHQEIYEFYQKQIQKLFNKENISSFLQEYSYSYETIRKKFINMPILPSQLQITIPKYDLNQSIRSNISTSQSLSNLDMQILQQQQQLQNKFISKGAYQDQAEFYKLEILKNKNFIQKVEENYLYYFDLEFLKFLKRIYSEMYLDLNEKQMRKIEKIQKLIDLQDQCYQMEIDRNYQIPNLVDLNHTYQYYVFKHMEDYYIQQKDKDQLSNFRAKNSQIISKLNKIDESKFEFNQISNNFETYVHQERCSFLKWFFLGGNDALNNFIKNQNLQKKEQQVDRESIIQDYNKKVNYSDFKQLYLQDAEEFQIGYAVDHKNNYYKGVFQNEQLIFGDILQVQENKIFHYESVSNQNNQICGKKSKKTVYFLIVQAEKQEIYEGEIKNGQYFGKGQLIKIQENTIYEGNFLNGLPEGRGVIRVKDKGFFKYEGNFQQGEYDDDNGKFYINIDQNSYNLETWKVSKGKKIKRKSCKKISKHNFQQNAI